MGIGSYVIGCNTIYLSKEDIPEKLYCANEDYATCFSLACNKLSDKLECLVIVNPLLNKPQICQEIVGLAKEYANEIYVISPTVALLQRTISNAGLINAEKLLILIKIDGKYLAIKLEKNGIFQFTPVSTQMESMKSLHHQFYSCFGTIETAVYCIFGDAEIETNVMEPLQLQFPSIKFSHFSHHLKSLVIGGLSKATAIIEPNQHFEVENFSTEILMEYESIVDCCSTFPCKTMFKLKAKDTVAFDETLSIRITTHPKWDFKKLKFYNETLAPSENYHVLEFGETGLMQLGTSDANPFDIFAEFFDNVDKIVVCSKESQRIGVFDFRNSIIRFAAMKRELKELLTPEGLKDEKAILKELIPNGTGLVTVFMDEKSSNYSNGPKVSVAPSYIGLLQYLLILFKPFNQKLVFLISTKFQSKFFVLTQKSPLFYMVTYISKPDITFLDEEVKCGFDDVGLYYVSEKGSKNAVFVTNFREYIHHELDSFEEASLYGGAIYALQNSMETLISPYCTIDPILFPQNPRSGNNNEDEEILLSKKSSNSFFEIEAFFHGALKFCAENAALFWGDLIAVICKRGQQIYIFLFQHSDGKFCFKFDLALVDSESLTSDVLHYAEVVIIENFQRLPLPSDVIPFYFSWPVDSNVNRFLEDLEEENLRIYDTSSYADMITKAVERKLYPAMIYHKRVMVVEILENECKIALENNKYVTDSSGAESIPLTISFAEKPILFGTEAVEHIERFPKSVIYDFIQLLGVTSDTLTADKKWKAFELVPLDASEDPKLGYKIATPDGPKIIPPEIAAIMFFQKLMQKFYGFTGSTNIDEIKLLSDKSFSSSQKEVLKKVGKKIKVDFAFARL